MENGQGCWVYYESTLESSFFLIIIIAPKTESFEQVGGKWKPGPHV